MELDGTGKFTILRDTLELDETRQDHLIFYVIDSDFDVWLNMLEIDPRRHLLCMSRSYLLTPVPTESHKLIENLSEVIAVIDAKEDILTQFYWDVTKRDTGLKERDIVA